MSLQLYIDNDNVLELDELKNYATDAYINDATVTATLKDESGTEVTGQTWPLTMAYVSASNGKYRGTLEYNLSVTTAEVYTAEIEVNGGSGLIGHFESRVVAVTRRTS